jgi:hypothetical protein
MPPPLSIASLIIYCKNPIDSVPLYAAIGFKAKKGVSGMGGGGGASGVVRLANAKTGVELLLKPFGESTATTPMPDPEQKYQLHSAMRIVYVS